MSKDYMGLEIGLLRTTEATTVSTRIMERKVTLYDIFMPLYISISPFAIPEKCSVQKLEQHYLEIECTFFFLLIDRMWF